MFKSAAKPVIGLAAMGMMLSVILTGCGSSPTSTNVPVTVVPSVKPSVVPTENASPVANSSETATPAPSPSNSTGETVLDVGGILDVNSKENLAAVDKKTAAKFADYGGAKKVLEAVGMLLQLQGTDWSNEAFIYTDNFDPEFAMSVAGPVFDTETASTIDGWLKTYGKLLPEVQKILADDPSASNVTPKQQKTLDDFVAAQDSLKSIFLLGWGPNADYFKLSKTGNPVLDYTWDTPKYETVDMKDGSTALKVMITTHAKLAMKDGTEKIATRTGNYYLTPNTSGNQYPWTIWSVNHLSYSLSDAKK